MLNTKNAERVRKMRVHVSTLDGAFAAIGHAMVDAVALALEVSQTFGNSPHIENDAANAGYRTAMQGGRFDIDIELLARELSYI